MAELYIGTSGWNYEHWKDHFYSDVPRARWLAHYAGHFPAVEVNATFYRLQKPATLAQWHDATPPDFRFCIKGNRYVTHNKQLKDPLQPVRLEQESARPLGDKLAVVLWQLPGNLDKHPERLAGFVKALRCWKDVRHAIEFRHESWFDDQTADCLAEHGIANCLSDAADWPMWTAATTDLVYVRLHGHSRTYASAYRDDSLAGWAASIQGWLDEGRSVHVYFDNDAEGAAPGDALKLAGLLRRQSPAGEAPRAAGTTRCGA